RELKEVVGEVGIFGQQGAMEVGAIGVVVDTALTPVFAVVAVPGEHTPQGTPLGTKICAAAVVLEADQRACFPTQRHIAYTARNRLASMDRPGVEDAGA